MNVKNLSNLFNFPLLDQKKIPLSSPEITENDEKTFMCRDDFFLREDNLFLTLYNHLPILQSGSSSNSNSSGRTPKVSIAKIIRIWIEFVTVQST